MTVRSGRQKPGQPKNDEYYTPKFIFDGLGLLFDLDVAAPLIQTNVPALQKYTIVEDGLSQPWNGLIWMNPPFSKANPWADRFMEHRNGIALLPATQGKWFERIWQDADAFLLLSRLKFDRPDNLRRDVFMPTFLIAYGDVSVEALSKSNLGKARQ